MSFNEIELIKNLNLVVSYNSHTIVVPIKIETEEDQRIINKFLLILRKSIPKSNTPNPNPSGKETEIITELTESYSETIESSDDYEYKDLHYTDESSDIDEFYDCD